MGTLAIEINDAGLVVAAGGAVLAVEPGYALVDDDRIQTGWEAYRQSRLKPKNVSNRYWGEISLEPESAQGLAAANAAELAFAHIEKLWSKFGGEGDDAILIVPEHFLPEQLGLMLGLAQESGMRVRAMVDSAVASALRPYPGRQLVHVDTGLHRVSVTTIGQGEEATVGSNLALETAGIASLTDAFANRIAEVFVLTTRFDPMHQAVSEQLLYDRLPGWLDELHSSESIEASLPFGDDEFTVEIAREQLLGAASGFYRAVVQLIAQSRDSAAPLLVQISDRLARLPGFGAELARLDDAEIVALESGHAALAVLSRAAEIGSGAGGIRLLKHLPWHEPPAEAPVPQNREAKPMAQQERLDLPVPTHVVYRGIAYDPGGEGLLIGRAEVNGQRTIVIDEGQSGVSRSHCEIRLRDGELRLRDLSRYGTYVNEKRVSGETTLRPADVIRIGSPGAELYAIRLENRNGS